MFCFFIAERLRVEKISVDIIRMKFVKDEDEWALCFQM